MFVKLKKNEAKAPFVKNENMAGTCGNRTHHGQDRCPTTGFEDQANHQAHSAPVNR